MIISSLSSRANEITVISGRGRFGGPFLFLNILSFSPAQLSYCKRGGGLI